MGFSGHMLFGLSLGGIIVGHRDLVREIANRLLEHAQMDSGFPPVVG